MSEPKKSGPKKRNALIQEVHDKKWIDFFYLERTLEALYTRLHALQFSFVPDSRDIPFNAQIRGYKGALDGDGSLWLLREVERGEAFSYTLHELAYYLDFLLDTLSAPTILIRREDAFFRATKVIVEATQISGYSYLAEPFRRTLANDLINRWLTFDEDRNPNNYMVVHNSKNDPLIVAIDFNHADLESPAMKITGNDSHFGWYRTEKTRFLTLLKPENFDGYAIEDFEERLSLMMSIAETRLKKLSVAMFSGVVDTPAKKAQEIVGNILRRRSYIDGYFRTWFKKRSERPRPEDDARAEGLGKSFVDIYKKRV
jgi:hypothetical protein